MPRFKVYILFSAQTGSVAKEMHYIYAPTGLVAVMIKTGNTQTLYFTSTDLIGNVTALVNTGGTLVEEYSLDPWGLRRNPSEWSAYTTAPPPTIITRLFTGHESMEQFGLINMNSRLYDPVLGRMLSPDNYIQSAGNSQNYNRYSYVLNNPLRYTDPSGDIIFTILAMLICPELVPLGVAMDVAGASDVLSNIGNGHIKTLEDGITYYLAGAAGVAATYLSSGTYLFLGGVALGGFANFAADEATGNYKNFYQSFTTGALSALSGAEAGINVSNYMHPTLDALIPDPININSSLTSGEAPNNILKSFITNGSNISHAIYHASLSALSKTTNSGFNLNKNSAYDLISTFGSSFLGLFAMDYFWPDNNIIGDQIKGRYYSVFHEVGYSFTKAFIGSRISSLMQSRTNPLSWAYLLGNITDAETSFGYASPWILIYLKN